MASMNEDQRINLACSGQPRSHNCFSEGCRRAKIIMRQGALHHYGLERPKCFKCGTQIAPIHFPGLLGYKTGIQGSVSCVSSRHEAAMTRAERRFFNSALSK